MQQVLLEIHVRIFALR